MVEYKSPPRTTPCTPSELHPYIYHFLIQHGLPKTAKHFKKEAGKESCVPPTGDDLLNIFSKHLCAAQPEVVAAPPVYSAVPPPSFDETLAVESPAVETNEKEVKKSKKKKRKLEGESPAVEDAVEDDVKPKKKKKKSKKDEVVDNEVVAAVAEQPVVTKAETPIKADEPEKTKKKKKSKKDETVETVVEPTAEEPAEVKPESMNNVEESVEDKPEKTKKKKKSKKDKTAAAEETTPEPETTTVETESTTVEKETTDSTEETTETVADENTESEDTKTTDSEQTEVAKTKKLKKNDSFRRVISENVFVPNDKADNSFEAKIGARGDWGEKANADLKFTKGKSFRHEKTKKKRGSYRGGNINVSVNSIKFSDDED